MGCNYILYINFLGDSVSAMAKVSDTQAVGHRFKPKEQ